MAQDQLKLRAGLVRCGACHEIFNGVESLLADADQDSSSTHEAAINPATQQPLPHNDTLAASSSDALDFAYPDFSESPSDSIESVESVESVDFIETPRPVLDASRQRQSLHDEEEPPSESPSLHTLHDLSELDLPAEPYLSDIESPDTNGGAHARRRQPLSEEDAATEDEEVLEEAEDAPDADEPDFLRHGRRRQKLGRGLRITMLLASCALLLGALAQTIYIFRDQLAARLPQAKPALLTACSYLQCRISLPAQIESITIESNELETVNPAKGDSMLTMLLRNVSTTAQTWPYVELTLNDANGTMLARRVFAPREYLPDAQAATAGLPADSEQSIKLYIEYSDAKPAGYHVGVFYP